MSTIVGTSGNDTITIDSDKGLQINSKSGNDTITIDGNGNNDIDTGSGNDTVTIIGNGDNDVDSGSGNDIVTIIGNGDNDVDSGSGNDIVTIIGSGDNDIDSGSGNDIVNITGNGNNHIDTGNGNDVVNITGNGFNVINLGNGNDTVTISGDSHERSLIFLGNGTNTVHGGDGNDIIVGKNGNDTVFFSQGTDIFYGSGGTDTLVFNKDRQSYDVESLGFGFYFVRDLATNATTYFSSVEQFQFTDQTLNLTQALNSNGVALTIHAASLELTENVGNAQDLVSFDLKALMSVQGADANATFTLGNAPAGFAYSIVGSVLTFDLNQFDALNTGQQAVLDLNITVHSGTNQQSANLALTIDGVTDSASANGQILNGAADPTVNVLDNLGYNNVDLKVGAGDSVHLDFHVNNDSSLASTIDASALGSTDSLNLTLDGNSFNYEQNVPTEIIFDFASTMGAGPAIYSVDATAVEYKLIAGLIDVTVTVTNLTGSLPISFFNSGNVNIDAHGTSASLLITEYSGITVASSMTGAVTLTQLGGISSIDGSNSNGLEVWNITASGIVNAGASFFGFGGGLNNQININATNLDSATRLALYDDYVAAGHTNPTSFDLDGLTFSYAFNPGGVVNVLLTNYNNDGPHIQVTNPLASVNEDAAASAQFPIVIADLAITDSEHDGGTFSVTGGVDASKFAVVNNQLLLIAAPDGATQESSLSVTVTATDPFGKTSAQTITVPINEVDMMVANGAITSQTDTLSTDHITLNNIASYFTNSDLDQGANTYSFSVTLSDGSVETNPSWVSVDTNGNLIISQIPDNAAHVGSLSVTVTAADLNDAINTASQTFTLTVADDVAPVLVHQTADQSIIAGNTIWIQDPFLDGVTANPDQLTYTLSINASGDSAATGITPSAGGSTPSAGGGTPSAGGSTPSAGGGITGTGITLVTDSVNHSGMIGIQVGNTANLGTDQLSITATDAAGNTSAAETFNLMINSIPPLLFSDGSDNVTFDTQGNANGQLLSYYDSASLYNTGGGDDVVSNLQFMGGLDTTVFHFGDGVDQLNMVNIVSVDSSQSTGTSIPPLSDTVISNLHFAGIDAGNGGDTFTMSDSVTQSATFTGQNFGTSAPQSVDTIATVINNSFLPLLGGAGNDDFSISAHASSIGGGDTSYYTILAIYMPVNANADAIGLENSTLTMDGGAGNDTLSISATATAQTNLDGFISVGSAVAQAYALDASVVHLIGGAGDDSISVTASASAVENLIENPGHETSYALYNNSVATIYGGTGNDIITLGNTDNGIAGSTSHFTLEYNLTENSGNDVVHGFLLSNAGYELQFDNIADLSTLNSFVTFKDDGTGHLQMNLWSDSSHTTSMGTVDFVDVSASATPSAFALAGSDTNHVQIVVPLG